MTLPDPGRSRLILAGGATYEDVNLPDLPSVAANVEALFDVLTDPELSIFAPPQLMPLVDVNGAELLDEVFDFARDAADLLLFYFAGHGLVSGSEQTLRLAAKDTRRDRFYTGVPFDEIAKIIHLSPARAKLVILDSCYSGRAKHSLSAAPPPDLAARAETEGLYLLTSAASDYIALAPAGQRFTAFTGMMLDVMRTGLPNNSPALSIDQIFGEIRTRSTAGSPVPQKWDFNLAGRVGLIRNAAYRRRQVPLDLSRSRAVLLGTATYHDRWLPPSPRSGHDVAAVRDMLTDPSICGFAPDHCRVVVDAATPAEVLGALHDAAAEALDQLVVYISGHTVVGAGDDLAFPVTGSAVGEPATMLAAERLAEAISLARSRATLVIVDASMSGRLVPRLSALRHTSVMTSCGRNQFVQVEDGQGVFTAGLVRVLRDGLTGRASHLTIVDVAQGLSGDAGAHQSSLQTASAPCLFHNRAEMIDREAAHPCLRGSVR